jgi:hypothetical protein
VPDELVRRFSLASVKDSPGDKTLLPATKVAEHRGSVRSLSMWCS